MVPDNPHVELYQAAPSNGKNYLTVTMGTNRNSNRFTFKCQFKVKKINRFFFRYKNMLQTSKQDT